MIEWLERGAPLALALILAPLWVGIVNRTKAWFGGRRGAPLLQRYRDIAKLCRKGAVYSRTTTWVFRAGPVISLAALIVALAMVPLGPVPAGLHFSGDFLVVLGLLALGRFAIMAAALDTGSAFEGMGASREAHFGALAEPVAFIALAVLVRTSGGELSLSTAYAALASHEWAMELSARALAAVALLGVFVVETSRMPVDDPTTHLELTMIHEVMVLDHSGPDLAFIEYAATLKLWLLGVLVVGLVVPIPHSDPWLGACCVVLAMAMLAVALGVVESVMARLRLTRVDELIIAAGACATVALVLTTVGF